MAETLKHSVNKKEISKFLRNLESDIFYFKRTKNNKELYAIRQSIERYLSINSQDSEKSQRDLNDGLNYILQRVL